jgi:predicted dehydrogenase/threonine dehydrogenase-like Zn-dependent dehydrogenase
MIQVVVKKGKVIGESVPAPSVSDGSALIKVMYSCISPGTETSTVRASEKSLIKKAFEQPAKVKTALKMLEVEGISKTIEKIRGRLDSGSIIGYSLSGIILAIGKGIKDLKIGDHVACAGSSHANHAEYVDVPRNLIVKLPKGLGFREASTVALGSIAMQGIRRANITFGEYAVIFGLGALGQIALQVAKNAGSRVIGIDLDTKRLEIGEENGADLILNPKSSDIVKEVSHFTNGFGADTVIFVASTKSSEPLHQAFQMTRKKGKVVLIGVSGMEIRREDLYAKELDFLISTSYGPGRYDDQYEINGVDYPYAYVRWSENRNMQEYLDELAEGKINVTNLIEKIYPIENVEEAYEELHKPFRPLTVLLKYHQDLPENLLGSLQKESKVIVSPQVITKKGIVNVAIVGAGSFATSVHLPNLAKLGERFKIHAIMGKTPYKTKMVAQQYHAHYATCNMDDILGDKDVDLVMISTRHNLHGEYVLKALSAGKNVFVEKPLCILEEELEAIKGFYKSQLMTPNSQLPLLMVGFNRRFSKYAQVAKLQTDKRINPLYIHYRVNAGYIPLDHWVHGKEGGGRIIGEACHFIDLFSFFTECKVKEIHTSTLAPKTKSLSSDDNRVVVLKYEDGSLATLEYFATGSKEFPKEYCEIHFDEKTIIIDDYQSIKGNGVKIHEMRGDNAEKGHLREWEVLYQVLQGETEKWPIELWDMLQTTEITLAIEKGDN